MQMTEEYVVEIELRAFFMPCANILIFYAYAMSSVIGFLFCC